MAVMTWYRGLALGVRPEGTDTGGLHDVGDGIYFTADFDTARRYAVGRNQSRGGTGSLVFQVKIDMSRFRVLDLTRHPAWRPYLARTFGSHRIGEMIKTSSTMHGHFFGTFCKENGIDLGRYDMVLAQDLQSAGGQQPTVQMVMLYRNREPTLLHAEALSKMQLVERNGTPQRAVADATQVVGGPNTTPGAQVAGQRVAGVGRDKSGGKVVRVGVEAFSAKDTSRHQRVLGRQRQQSEAAALRMAGLAQALAGLALQLNSRSMESRVKDELAKHEAEIAAAFEVRQGVLVIIHVAVERRSEAGFQARSFENLWLQPGWTADDALTRWRTTPAVFASLPANAPYEFVEEYRWLEPAA